ncbi:MAG: hypothetical protein SynsKO_20300 [Synoicihabitans sp.]
MNSRFEKSDTVGLVALALCLTGAIWLGKAGWEITALSGHEFRQAQTALSIQAMQETGFRLDYETPVLGKPWSIPMEFPLYQWLVVQWSQLTGDPVAQSGRWVSAIMFGVGLIGVFQLLRLAGLSIGASALAMCPLVVTPIYIFYSRTVLIESLAWTLAVWFLWGICRFRASRTTRWFAFTWGVGALAVVVKATTWAIFCLPWAVLFLQEVFSKRREWKSHLRGWLPESLGIGVPLLLLGYGWVSYGDTVKAQNPIGRFLLSENLTEFNFGTWAMRTSAYFWESFFHYVTTGLVPFWSLCAGLVLALIWKKSRPLLALGGIAFAGGPLIFSGLYVAHDYYFYANGAFLVLALSAGIAIGWDHQKGHAKRRVALLGLLAMGIYGQISTYYETYRHTQTVEAHADFGLPQVVRALVARDEVVAAHSPNWSSTIPFYSQRKMLTVPDAEMYHNPENVQQAIQNLSDESVPLFLMIGDSRIHPRWVADRITDFNLLPSPIFEWAEHVTGYARGDRASEMISILEREQFHNVVINGTAGLLPAENRISLQGEAEIAQLEKLGIAPTEAVFPFGLSVGNNHGDLVMLVHSPTEVFFDVPPGATHLETGFSVNRDSYEQEDWDGIIFHFDFLDEEENVISWQFKWIPPSDDYRIHHEVWELPERATNRMVLRVMQGGGGGDAFDQGLLHYLRFVTAD